MRWGALFRKNKTGETNIFLLRKRLTDIDRFEGLWFVRTLFRHYSSASPRLLTPPPPATSLSSAVHEAQSVWCPNMRLSSRECKRHSWRRKIGAFSLNQLVREHSIFCYLGNKPLFDHPFMMSSWKTAPPLRQLRLTRSVRPPCMKKIMKPYDPSLSLSTPSLLSPAPPLPNPL